MVKAFADLIEAGRKTIDDVPAKIKEDVIKELEKRGYIIEE